jgi:hypothetical protein
MGEPRRPTTISWTAGHERAMAYPLARFRILPLIYVIVGIVVASQHHYFQNLSTGRQIVNMLLAVIFWPLVLLHHPIVIR